MVKLTKELNLIYFIVFININELYSHKEPILNYYFIADSKFCQKYFKLLM